MKKIYVIIELLHLQELPNICNIFETIVKTGIDNKKLSNNFWENELYSEVLKSFLQEIMGFVLSQESIECKDNTHFSISILCQNHSKVSSSIIFLWWGSWGKWYKCLLMLIYIYDSVNQGHVINHQFEWMSLNSRTTEMWGHRIHTLVPTGWIRASDEMNRSASNVGSYVGRSHCLYKTILFLGETRKIPEWTINAVLLDSMDWIPL